MKNNFIINLLFFILFLFHFLIANSDELKFEAKSIEIVDKNKVIIAKDDVKIFAKDEIEIDADRMRYNKEENFLNASGNIIIRHETQNIEIYSNNISYDRNKEKIVSSGDVLIKFEDQNTLNTEEIIFLKSTGEILINNLSKIKDKFQNEIEMEKLNYNLNDKLLKGKEVKLIDFEKNLYNFNTAIVDFSKNQIIADGVSIDFNKGIFGNPSNDPRLKGNYFFSDKKNSIIKKGVFTTCKKNNDCPWQIKAKEINHDKQKKIINYKSAWLEIYDKPIIYFPNFFIRSNCEKTIRFFNASSDRLV